MSTERRAPASCPRQESAAGRWAETRIAPDGSQLTQAQFLNRYGDNTNWNRARCGGWAETRIAPDGSVLTLTQFLRRYGKYENWNRARQLRKAVMRLEPQAPPSDHNTRGRTAGLEGGLRSPKAGGSTGGGHAGPSAASALCQHCGPTAGCTLNAAHPSPLRRAPLICLEHTHSQAADALAALAAAEEALRRERLARAESESALSRERSKRQHSPSAQTVEDALCDNEVAHATPRRWCTKPADVGSPASSQGNTPSGESTSSTGPECRCLMLELLEHPTSFQAAAALAELARSKARAAVAAQVQRLEREGRLRDEAAHCRERERLERAADELRSQLASLQTCIDERCALRDELAAARREAAAAARELGACRTLLEIEQKAARLPAAENHEREAVHAQEATVWGGLSAALAAGPKRAKKRRKGRAKRGDATVAPPGARDSYRMSDEEVLNVWAIAHRIAEYVPIKFAVLCSSMARISYVVTLHQYECWSESLEFCLRMQCQVPNPHIREFGPPVVAMRAFQQFDNAIAAEIRAGRGLVELRKALHRRADMVQLIFHEYCLRFEDLVCDLRPFWRSLRAYNANLLAVLRAQELRMSGEDAA